jgi:chromate reductase
MGATTGQIGTARAQYHLRQILVQTDSIVLNRPEVMISFVKEKFNQSNQLTDDKTLQKIKELVEALVAQIRL